MEDKADGERLRYVIKDKGGGHNQAYQAPLWKWDLSRALWEWTKQMSGDPGTGEGWSQGPEAGMCLACAVDFPECPLHLQLG